MKKLIYALGIGLVCGLGATAANPQAATEKIVKKSSLQQGMSSSIVKIDKEELSKREVKRKVQKSDFYGYWKWEGENALNQVNWPNEGVMTIEPIEGSDSISIKGFDLMADEYTDGLRGYFDSATGRLLIPNQVTRFEGTMLPNEQGDMVEADPCMFIARTCRGFTEQEIEDFLKNPEYEGENPADYIILIEAPEGASPFFFRMRENGTLSCTDVYDHEWFDTLTPTEKNAWYAQNWTSATDVDLLVNNSTPEHNLGFWWYCLKIGARQINPFEFNPVEWENIGNAMFKDAWLAPLYVGTEFESTLCVPYEVPVWRNPAYDRRYLLQDPYGPNTVWGGTGLNLAEDIEGYLEFDIITDENGDNIVVFHPYVYSLTIPGSIIAEEDPQRMYNYNIEGYYYYTQNQTIDKIFNIFDQMGRDLSYCDIATGKVNIYNGCFDLLPLLSFGTGMSWVNKATEGYIQLPAEWDGVEGIEADEADAPAVYYNLQGVRVNNPAKGQIVIVAKGNKVTKQVIR